MWFLSLGKHLGVLLHNLLRGGSQDKQEVNDATDGAVKDTGSRKDYEFYFQSRKST